MIASLAVTAGLLLQAAGNGHPARANRAPDPVRIWRTDSTAYVALRQPGDLLVLHVDAIGRIQVLFPAGPDDDSAMLANDTLVAIPLPPAAEGNPATFVAVRSRWAFEFAALRAGSAWNYNGALLLQPTAGDPLVRSSPPPRLLQRSGLPTRSRRASSCRPAPSCGRSRDGGTKQKKRETCRGTFPVRWRRGELNPGPSVTPIPIYVRRQSFV